MATTEAISLTTLHLTPEQVITVHAALSLANTISRQHQLHFLQMHESENVGQATRDESWKTFKKWEKHENETAQVMQAIQATKAELPFSAWNRFPQV